MNLPAEDEKAAAVEAMFDRIAPRYDRMNRLMTFGLDRSWRRRTVEEAAIGAGDRVLDLACGTGDLASEVRRAGGIVTAIDVSAGMLEVARRRTSGRCAWLRGDALRLPLRDGAFDAIVSGFALRNFVDVGAVLAECARVLKPGGRLALLEVDTPSRRWLRIGHRLWFYGLVPLLGRLLADTEAYSYLPSSVVYLPAEARLRAILAAAGFHTPTKTMLLGGAVQVVAARREAARG